jgi:hypothetical protein
MRIFSIFSSQKRHRGEKVAIIIHMPFYMIFPFVLQIRREMEETRVERYIFIMLQLKDDKNKNEMHFQIDIIHLPFAFQPIYS